MSYLKIFSYKNYYIFCLLLVLFFSEMNCKDIDLSSKLLFQYQYNLNNNLTNLILKDSEEQKEERSPMDYFFDVIRKNFHNLFTNKKYDLSKIREACIKTLNLTFVNYSGTFNSSSSNYYIAKLFEDSSKNKNDLGLYNQCFIKQYRFNKSITNENLTEYYILIIDKTINMSTITADFDTQYYLLGFCLPKNDDCSNKDLSELIYTASFALNNVFNIKKNDVLEGFLVHKETKTYNLNDLLYLIPFIILFFYIIFVYFSKSIFLYLKSRKKIENDNNIKSLSKKYVNKEINECFDWRENGKELFNTKLTYTKINNYSGLTYIKGIRGLAMFHIILGFTFFAIFNSPVRVYGNNSLYKLLTSLIYPIFAFGLKYSPAILFSCSGYCLNYKLMCYFDDKSENNMKVFPFILYQSHKYFMLIFTILFCKFSFFTLFKGLDSPIWFYFGRYFCDRPAFSDWRFYLLFFIIPQFSYDLGGKGKQNIYDYLWMVYNEIFFFIVGVFIVYINYKFKYRGDRILLFLIGFLYIFKIGFCCYLNLNQIIYPSVYYYFLNYGKLMINPIFNLSYFLIGMFFGSINFTIQKGILVPNDKLNESNELQNKPYLLIPSQIINLFKSIKNTKLTIFILFQIIVVLFFSMLNKITDLFVGSSSTNDEKIKNILGNQVLNILLIIDNEIIVIITLLISSIFYIKGVNLINDFFSNNFWLTLNRFYFSFILIINIIILFVIYLSETMINFSLANIVLYSLICGFFILVISSFIYSFVELPFKKIIKILIQRKQNIEIINKKKDEEEEEDEYDDDD